MRIAFIIPLILAALAAILYFSDQYDYQVNGDKIAVYQCKSLETIPILDDFFEKKGDPNLLYKKEGHRFSLYNSNISTLPENSFSSLPCLEEVYLNDNQLTSIPRTLQFLPNLSRLDLRNNNITTLRTDIFKDFFSLDNLSFSGNPIKILDFFETNSSIHSFSCNNCQISEVAPIEEGRLSISEIDLSSNRLSKFPVELLEFTSLTTLNLAYNNIKIFEGVEYTDFYRPYLRNINLQSNYLTEIPEHLYHIPNLEVLNLNENDISDAIYIKGFISMKELIIPNQFITDVFFMDFMYDGYGNTKTLNEFLPSMLEIDLSNNKIETFQVEKGIFNESITTINLQKNRLKAVPSEIDKFEELKKLDLSRNKIEAVETQTFRDFRGLFVNLSHNKIKEVIHSNTFEKINLFEIMKDPYSNHDEIIFEKMDLSHNLLTEIPPVLVKKNNVKELDLSNNKIQNLEIQLTEYDHNLEILDLSNNPIQKWSQDILHLTFLRELNLSNTSIAEIPIKDLQRMEFLETLILKNTKIPTLYSLLYEVLDINIIFE
jgi:Leucine-rich repeat (LRR) protein